MVAVNHKKINNSLFVMLICFFAANMFNNSFFGSFSYLIVDYFFPANLSFKYRFFKTLFILILSILFLKIGTLLPDIDNKGSVLGSKLYNMGIDIESYIGHRTYTHSIWLVLILFVLGKFFVPFRFMFFGVLVHIFVDSFSKAGICFVYPLKKYIHYNSGAFVADGHRYKLYTTGSDREYLIVKYVKIICIVLSVYFFFTGGFSNLFGWLVG